MELKKIVYLKSDLLDEDYEVTYRIEDTAYVVKGTKAA